MAALVLDQIALEGCFQTSKISCPRVGCQILLLEQTIIAHMTSESQMALKRQYWKNRTLIQLRQFESDSPHAVEMEILEGPAP